MLAAVVEDVLERDGAVGNEVVVADWRVVEDGQLDFAAVVHLRGELVVPRGAVGLLARARLAHARVVHVERDVRVQQEALRLGPHGVTQGPGGGLELQRLANLYLQLAVEDHHGGRLEMDPVLSGQGERKDNNRNRNKQSNRLLLTAAPFNRWSCRRAL